MKIVVTTDVEGNRTTTIDDKPVGSEVKVSCLLTLGEPPKLFVQWGSTPWQVSKGELWVDDVLQVRVGDMERLLAWST